MNERGISLVLVLLATSFLVAIGLGLTLVVTTHLMVVGNYRRSVAMLAAAEAGVELAAHDLSLEPDWSAVLAGSARSTRADGAPSGARVLPGGRALDLDAQTNLINCGRASACTSAQLAADSRDRPWGANNPRWRLFAYGPFADFGPFVRPGPYYLMVWLGDDSREADGDPSTDGGSADHRGEGVVRVRADAIGMAGGRRSVEAELARVCRIDGGVEHCQPGIRVQSWRELRQVLP